MYRLIKNKPRGRNKTKDERGTTNIWCELESYTSLGVLFFRRYWGHSQSYHNLLSHFLEVLRRQRDQTGSVIWQETIGWKPRIKFSWDKPQSFSPQEAADYVEKRKLLSDNWNYFEGRWQIYSSKSEEQHYFDIDIYHTTFPMGSLEVGELKHKVTLECLLTK